MAGDALIVRKKKALFATVQFPFRGSCVVHHALILPGRREWRLRRLPTAATKTLPLHHLVNPAAAGGGHRRTAAMGCPPFLAFFLVLLIPVSVSLPPPCVMWFFRSGDPSLAVVAGCTLRRPASRLAAASQSCRSWPLDLAGCRLPISTYRGCAALQQDACQCATSCMDMPMHVCMLGLDAYGSSRMMHVHAGLGRAHERGRRRRDLLQ
jgi:hypothetical protein